MLEQAVQVIAVVRLRAGVGFAAGVGHVKHQVRRNEQHVVQVAPLGRHRVVHQLDGRGLVDAAIALGDLRQQGFESLAAGNHHDVCQGLRLLADLLAGLENRKGLRCRRHAAGIAGLAVADYVRVLPGSLAVLQDRQRLVQRRRPFQHLANQHLHRQAVQPVDFAAADFADHDFLGVHAGHAADHPRVAHADVGLGPGLVDHEQGRCVLQADAGQVVQHAAVVEFAPGGRPAAQGEAAAVEQRRQHVGQLQLLDFNIRGLGQGGHLLLELVGNVLRLGLPGLAELVEHPPAALEALVQGQGVDHRVDDAARLPGQHPTMLCADFARRAVEHADPLALADHQQPPGPLALPVAKRSRTLQPVQDLGPPRQTADQRPLQLGPIDLNRLEALAGHRRHPGLALQRVEHAAPPARRGPGDA